MVSASTRTMPMKMAGGARPGDSFCVMGRSIESAAADAHLFDGPQSHRAPVRVHESCVPADRLPADARAPLAPRMADGRAAARRQAARRISGGRRHPAAGVLPPARCDARHHHGVPGRGAARRGRIRQLPHSTDDRRAGHGVPAAERAQLLAVSGRGPCDARRLLPAWRRSRIGMDVVSPARGYRHHRARPRG